MHCRVKESRNEGRTTAFRFSCSALRWRVHSHESHHRSSFRTRRYNRRASCIDPSWILAFGVCSFSFLLFFFPTFFFLIRRHHRLQRKQLFCSERSVASSVCLPCVVDMEPEEAPDSDVLIPSHVNWLTETEGTRRDRTRVKARAF
jgi:hypothetical protein